jgi:hypothetical protein
MALAFYTTKDLSPLLISEITDFLDSQDTGHIFQFPQWNVSGARFALQRDRGSIRWFGAFGMHAPLGSTLPWMRAVIANRGPVCDDGKVWQAAIGDFIGQMKREGVAYFDAAPDWVQTPDVDVENSLRHSGWEGLGGERLSLRLDLTKPEDEIFANFRKNSRYEVRRAERLGVSVVLASGGAEIEEFLTLHGRVAARKGFGAESPDRLRAIIDWLIGERSRGALLLARSENLVCGGAVIGRCGKRCWYVWGASDKHEHFNVGHILQWKALLWAKSHGCDDYDFGGYTLGATSGPAWFKAGFGGTLVRFVPAHRMVLRRGYYRMFNLIFQMREFSRSSSAVPWAKRASFPKSAPANLAEK